MNEFDITKEAALLKSKLPSLPRRPRKNLFDILKIQHREIRNSNILAYFFDPNEEHSFGSLFYAALKEIASEKIAALKKPHPNVKFNDISDFDEVLSVATEEQTTGAKETSKSIDIVIEGDDWVIGIENKIHHLVNNPLDAYWEHLLSKKDKKPFGILLTLHPTDPDRKDLQYGEHFVNITHKELIDTVKENLRVNGDLNSTDFFYLKEYFKNMESHYEHLKEKPEMDKLIKEVTNNYQTLNELFKKKKEAEEYVEKQVHQVFAKFGYVKASRWFRLKDRPFDLYFYIPPVSDLMKTNHLWLCFEIRNETNNKIDNSEFLNYFKENFKGLSNFNMDYTDTYKDRTHAFVYEEQGFFTKGSSFRLNFNEVMTRLIKVDNAPVQKVENYLLERGLDRKKE